MYTYFVAMLILTILLFLLRNLQPADDSLNVLFSNIHDPAALAYKLEFCRYVLANHVASEQVNAILHGLINIHFHEMEPGQRRRLMALLSETSNQDYQKEEIREFIKLIHAQYLSGIQRFKDNALLLSYCFFLKETDKSINKKKKIAEHSAVAVRGFFASYEIYCLGQYEQAERKHDGDRRQTNAADHKQQFGENQDNVESAKQVANFYSLLLGSIKAALRMTALLGEESPLIQDLLVAYSNFADKKLKVSQEWSKNLQLLKKRSDVLERYGIYLKHVLNNAKLGEKLLAEAKMLQTKEKSIGGGLTELDYKGLIEKISQISQPLLILKFEKNEIIIENCNQCFCNIIRYKRFEILEKSS